MRESFAAKRERTRLILHRLAETYPGSRCSLDHEGPFQLLVATVLSAQCTDARVNAATPALFAKYPTPAALAQGDQAEVEEIVRPLGFFRSKARAIIGLATDLVERFGAEVPATLEELTSLPGVGRKTANVVLGVVWGKAEGVVVDTHVKRIAYRLGLTRQTNPELVEEDLLRLLPVEERVVFTHRVIDHGRAICVARRPRCEVCPLADLCPSALVPAAAPAGALPGPRSSPGRSPSRQPGRKSRS